MLFKCPLYPGLILNGFAAFTDGKLETDDPAVIEKAKQAADVMPITWDEPEEAAIPEPEPVAQGTVEINPAPSTPQIDGPTEPQA